MAEQLQNMFHLVEQEMEAYNRTFESYMMTDNPLLHSILTNMSEHRGKGMRPLITILSAKLFGNVQEITYHLAAAYELFHNATLIHDDIIDESDTRRGQPSVYSLFGSRIAVLAGDYVLTNALISSIATQRIDLMEEVFRASRGLVDGELFQLYNISLEEISEQNYFDIIKKKTAILFASCAKSGTMTSTDNPNDINRMEQFGMLVGMCFQIKDDIFDYIAGDEIGKPRGNDMLEGKLTLPVIHVLLNSKNEEMLQLARKVKEGTANKEEIAQLVKFAIDNKGIEYACQVMDNFAQEAHKIIDSYPLSPVTNALHSYIDYVVKRNF